MEIIRRISTFISGMDFAVLSTVSPDGPWISLMSYLPGQDGLTLFLAMSAQSRKARFILENPSVALLIDNRRLQGDPARITALGIHGTAGFVTESEREAVLGRFRVHRPHLAGLLGRPDTGVVRVTPRSFQLFDGVDNGFFVTRGESGWHIA